MRHLFLKHYSEMTKNLFSGSFLLSCILFIVSLLAIWSPTDFFQQRFGWTAVLLGLIVGGLWTATYYSTEADSYNKVELKKKYEDDNQPENQPKFKDGGIVP